MPPPMWPVYYSEALVKVEVFVAFALQPLPDFWLEAVDVNGGHLGEDGTAEGRGKGQEESAQQDLGGGVDLGVPGQNAPFLQGVHEHGHQDHPGRRHGNP